MGMSFFVVLLYVVSIAFTLIPLLLRLMMVRESVCAPFF